MSDQPERIALEPEGFWAFVYEIGNSLLVPTGGFVSAQRVGEISFVRVDVPVADGRLSPRLFPASALSLILPTTEEKVRNHERPT